MKYGCVSPQIRIFTSTHIFHHFIIVVAEVMQFLVKTLDELKSRDDEKQNTESPNMLSWLNLHEVSTLET